MTTDPVKFVRKKNIECNVAFINEANQYEDLIMKILKSKKDFRHSVHKNDFRHPIFTITEDPEIYVVCRNYIYLLIIII